MVANRILTLLPSPKANSAAHLKADVAPCRSSSRSTKALVRPRSATCSASWLRPSPTNTRFSAWGWGQFRQVKYFVISKAYTVRGFKAAYLVRRRLQVEELHLVVLRAAVRLAADGLQQVRGAVQLRLCCLRVAVPPERHAKALPDLGFNPLT